MARKRDAEKEKGRQEADDKNQQLAKRKKDQDEENTKKKKKKKAEEVQEADDDDADNVEDTEMASNTFDDEGNDDDKDWSGFRRVNEDDDDEGEDEYSVEDDDGRDNQNRSTNPKTKPKTKGKASGNAGAQTIVDEDDDDPPKRKTKGRVQTNVDEDDDDPPKHKTKGGAQTNGDEDDDDPPKRKTKGHKKSIRTPSSPLPSRIASPSPPPPPPPPLLPPRPKSKSKLKFKGGQSSPHSSSSSPSPPPPSPLPSQAKGQTKITAFAHGRSLTLPGTTGDETENESVDTGVYVNVNGHQVAIGSNWLELRSYILTCTHQVLGCLGVGMTCPIKAVWMNSHAPTPSLCKRHNCSKSIHPCIENKTCPLLRYKSFRYAVANYAKEHPDAGASDHSQLSPEQLRIPFPINNKTLVFNLTGEQAFFAFQILVAKKDTGSTGYRLIQNASEQYALKQEAEKELNECYVNVIDEKEKEKEKEKENNQKEKENDENNNKENA